WRGGKPRTAALANDDVKRVLEMVRESVKRFPDHPDEWTWAMLVAAHPDEAKGGADALLKNEESRLEREVRNKLSPVNASQTLHACWRLDMAGKMQEAQAAWKRAASAGVPMPFDVP